VFRIQLLSQFYIKFIHQVPGLYLIAINKAEGLDIRCLAGWQHRKDTIHGCGLARRTIGRLMEVNERNRALSL
jgi:hypothetical protein